MTSASAPALTSRRAKTSAGAKQMSLAPPSLTMLAVRTWGTPPASTMWVTRAASVTRMSASSSGCMVMRLTPKGREVSAWVASISAASWSGFIAPQAMTPKPPAFEMAATRWRSLTHVIAPPMMPTSQPRKRVPRAQSASSRARASECPVAGGAKGAVTSGDIEAVCRVQRAHRKLGVFGADQYAHLDLAG